MMRMLKFLLIGTVAILGVVHAQTVMAGNAIKESSPTRRSGQVSPHNGDLALASGSTGMVGLIKNIKLSGYQGMKVGDAFERYRYFNKREWVETKTANGNVYVDFYGYSSTGWLDFEKKKERVSARGVNVKFFIHSDGSYGVGMVSRVLKKSDGTVEKVPLADGKVVLDAIFANREIVH